MTTTNATAASSNSDLFAAVNAKSSSLASSTKTENTAADQNERFLKLLTAQLNNQDPLNPLDNAQMTSQVAQISTVSGLEKLNTAMADMASQFLQLQALQGASLVGHDVLAAGNKVTLNEDKSAARGGFELPAAAGTTTVEVLNASGQVVATQQMGALAKGRHEFSLDVQDKGLSTSAAYTFRVVAQSGGTTLDTTTLVRDKVTAVTTSSDNKLTLELANGDAVAYSTVKTIK